MSSVKVVGLLVGSSLMSGGMYYGGRHLCASFNKEADTKDCYFDKECHAKVDWDKIGQMKERFFAKLKEMKQSGDKDIKPLLKHMHAGFVQAGMPEDRPDYILMKWVKYVYPEALDEEVDTKDCYFDKECHAKVDWDKIGQMKERFFAKLKEMKQSGDIDIKPLLKRMHAGFVQAGMPEDRPDYILMKWVKGAYPEALKQSRSLNQ